MPEDLPWSRFVDLKVNSTNPITYPAVNRPRNGIDNTNRAFDYIQNSYLLRAQFKDCFDSNDSFFIRENAPYSLLELAIAFSGPIPADKEKLEINLELHNGYHYIPLDIPTSFDLLTESGCNRGVDSETAQTVYYINWGDDSLSDIEIADAAKHFCDQKMPQFDTLWQYSAITDEDEKIKALKELNDQTKNDIILVQDLHKILILLSQISIDSFTGVAGPARHKVFLRSSTKMVDSDGSNVIHIVDSPPLDFAFFNNYGIVGNGAPTIYTDDYHDKYIEYGKLTRGGKPDTPGRLPSKFQTFL